MTSQQTASDFFFKLDNFTAFYPLNVAEAEWNKARALRTAYVTMFTKLQGETAIVNSFRESYLKDETLQDYAKGIAPFKENLEVVEQITKSLMVEVFGSEGGALDTPDLAAVREAFEFFGQGVLFDERRNNDNRACDDQNVCNTYDFWSVHSMDSRYPDGPPIGYYVWYIFVRALSLLVDEKESGAFPLSFARTITIAAAVQNTMKPAGASGPTRENPNNPPISSEELLKIRADYQEMTFADLDRLYATGGPNSPIGPPPGN